jgi:hypothetical protein
VRTPPSSDPGDPLLFTTREGFPLSRTRFRNRVWEPAVDLAELEPRPNFHDLRHSYAAWLIAKRGARQDDPGPARPYEHPDEPGPLRHLMSSLDVSQVDRMNAALNGGGGTWVARPISTTFQPIRGRP